MTVRRRGPKKKEAPEGYLRFADALRLFAPLSRGVFYYRVKIGDILSKKDTMGTIYAIESILSTKHILSQEKQKKLIEVYTDWIKISDVIAGLKLDRIVYQEEFLADMEHYKERKTKNPFTSIGVFDKHDRDTMYAYISLLPMKEETIMDILLGRRPETQITSHDILTYNEPGEYTLLASSAVHHPDYPELIGRLIHAFTDYWVEHYPARRIKAIYAETVSEDGKRIVNKLRMGPMYLMTNGTMKRIENAYVLDMREPAASPIIHAFQRRLQQKKG